MQNSESKTSEKKQENASSPNISAAEKQSIDLLKPGMPALIASRVGEEIDEYCRTAYDDGHRWHLGASLIGHECSRYLWYVFRWCFREPTTGRQQRLFNRGHREEDRFVEWLRGCGFEVWTHDTSAPQKANGEYPQYRISGVMGHFGGSLDGIAMFPARYNIEKPVLLEFKTNGTGQGFTKLKSEGMPVAKPQHFAQTSTYGYKYGFDHVLYLNICKNDDDLHTEIAKLDHKLGEQMEAKAERIITSDKAPQRLSDNPTFYKCGYCAAKDICHKGAIPEKNCRSCAFAKPVEGGEFFCETYNAIIPREYVPEGCGNHKPVTCNV